MKKHLPTISILTIIAAVICLGIWFSEKDSPIKQLAKLDVYSKEELSFLEKEGFLDDINSENLPSNKEQIISLLKSPTLIEQNLNSSDESFEVLATKLDESTYQLAFKLENKSNEKKEFYLIPISDESQLQFKEIKGRISGTITEAHNTSLTELYDVNQHKSELKPELAQAYQDIQNNNYQAKPIKLVLEPNSILIAQSKWQIPRDPILTENLKPVYLLVYGSAGGVKDELTILNIHSHPQAGDYWTVSFETEGLRDLIITPDDQASIDDLDFISLKCGDEERFPQILEGDVISYPNWFCSKEAKIVHIVNVANKHYLKFQFGSQTAFAYNAPDNWISPDSTNDPDVNWSNDDNIKDNNTGTYAYDYVSVIGWSTYLEAHLDTPISCDKVRFWAEYGQWRQSKISLDVYYEGGWHNIYEGIFADKTWVEKTIPAGTKTVSALKAKFYVPIVPWSVEFYETDFNETPVTPSVKIKGSTVRIKGAKLKIK